MVPAYVSGLLHLVPSDLSTVQHIRLPFYFEGQILFYHVDDCSFIYSPMNGDRVVVYLLAIMRNAAVKGGRLSKMLLSALFWVCRKCACAVC